MAIYQIETTSSDFSGLMEYPTLEAAEAAFESAWTISGSVELFIDGEPVDYRYFDEDGQHR